MLDMDVTLIRLLRNQTARAVGGDVQLSIVLLAGCEMWYVEATKVGQGMRLANGYGENKSLADAIEAAVGQLKTHVIKEQCHG